jgi:predicted AAA+ superfamily ATPase
MKNVSESLAGRIGLLTLLPFHYNEISKNQRDNAIWQGSYPEIVTRNYLKSETWYSAYIDTYLNKDVREMSQIGDLRDFQRFIKLLAANTSQIFNQSHYARDLAVSAPTIKRWISILEASYIIFLLPPYYENKGKRLVKSPKVYFWDMGIVTYLTNIDTRNHFEHGPMSGAIFENYIVAEIIKKDLALKNKSEFYYLRTSEGVEIDLIKINHQNREWIEIKKTSTFRPQQLHSIKLFLEKSDTGTLIYSGKKDHYNHQIKMENYKNYLEEL